jgi:hypothetical protein
MFEYIKLQRTMCFGTCPVYSVMVDNEGNVNYYGEMFVYKSGEHHWKISGKKVNQLNDLIEDFGFKSFIYEPGYEFITDLILFPYSNSSYLFFHLSFYHYLSIIPIFIIILISVVYNCYLILLFFDSIIGFIDFLFVQSAGCL